MNSLLSFRLQGLGADTLDVRVRALNVRVRALDSRLHALEPL